MARKKKHEEHQNHEAWAIPYADMITLLLAFFVVMYSISAVNEGKYRVLSDALSQAFGGPPKSIKPVQIGSKRQSGSDSDQKLNIFERSTGDQSIGGTMRDLRNPVVIPGKIKTAIPSPQTNTSGNTGYAGHAELQRMADAVAKAMGELIERNMIVVRKSETRLEVEIRTDILFASGSAQVADNARPVLAKLAGILKPFPNALRIEGHTDDVPIHTAAFASNWELSAARAASVVHLFMIQGVEPRRMSVEGFGEYRPAADNATVDGRNRNRRVVMVVLADTGEAVPPGVEAAGADARPSADAPPAAPARAPASP
ncbi:MAG: flagellar motor protein MotD [Nevskia sp.]|nr:flagellar motor protein MotD [Nevskia sp.]